MTREQLLPVIHRVMNKLMNLGASDLVYDKSMTEEQIETGLFARDFGIEEWEWPQGVGLYGLYKLQKFYGDNRYVEFFDNLIRNNRARGTLFSTPQKVVVENNLFDHTSGCAILLCGDCNGWFETGACRDVTIRKNHFINALTSQFQFTNAVISIYPEIPNLDGQKKLFHGGRKAAIRIEDNTFETFDAPILYAKSIDGLLFRNNKVVQNTDYKPFHWNKDQFLLQRVNNVEIEDLFFYRGGNIIKEVKLNK